MSIIQRKMETEFIYWRHHTIPGIKVEEVCGGEDRPQRLWLEMAYQLYCENGRDEYREIGHFRNGAPFLMGEDCRISITHTEHFLAVATLAATPDRDLSVFSGETALGIDAERADRAQTLRVRERFLNERELAMIAAEDVRQNVMAWTAKEALYKAALQPGLDFREGIRILEMPKLGPAVPVYDKKEYDPVTPGRAEVDIDGEVHSFILYSYESEGNIVTLAYTAASRRFGK